MMATFTLGPIVMHGRQFSGAGYVFTAVEDWYTLPDSKSQFDEFPQAPGAFDPGEDWPASAVFTVEGYIRGLTRAQTLAMQADLNKVRSVSELTLATFEDELGASSRRVSVRRVKVSDIRNQRHVPFVIDMQAPDPRRYSEVVSDSTELPSLSGGLVFPIVFPIDFAVTGDTGRVVTNNPGSADTFSTFEVDGGLAGGFSLVSVEDGREIRLEFPIATGSTVFVDSMSGRVWLDDEANDLTGFLTVSDWWAVPAGESRTVQFNSIGAVTGTPMLTARTAPADL